MQWMRSNVSKKAAFMKIAYFNIISSSHLAAVLPGTYTARKCFIVGAYL
jgi:hypothetical protein